MKRLTMLLMLIALMQVSACQSADNTEGNGESTASEEVQDAVDQMLVEEDRGTAVTLDAPVLLAYRFQAGDRFGYAISSIQKVNIARDSIEENNQQELTHWYRFEVLSAGANGGGRLRVTCERVLFKGSYTSGKNTRDLTYDSDSENSYDIEKQYAQYNAPVKAPFEMVVEADGRISAVENLDAMVKNYMRDDYKTTRSQDLGGVKQDLANMILKPVLQLAFQKLADDAVGKDSTWALVKPDNMGYLSYRSASTYAVRDVVSTPKGRLFHIGVDIASQYTGKKSFDTGQGMATMDVFDVTGKGLSVFNSTAGRVQRRSLRTDVHVRMYIEPPADMKELTNMGNFWMEQKAFVEDKIEPYSITAEQNSSK